MFLRMFLLPRIDPSSVDLQHRQPLGEVKQPMEGTQEEVPVPKRISSSLSVIVGRFRHRLNQAVGEREEQQY